MQNVPTIYLSSKWDPKRPELDAPYSSVSAVVQNSFQENFI